MRVALLGGGDALAAPVRAAGHEPVPIAAAPLAHAEGLLARRGFTPGLTAVPAALAALRRADADLVHAFGVPAAVAALGWRRLTGRPVVVTLDEVLDRAHVADRRLRRHTLAHAVEAPEAVLVPSEAGREALARWMAVEATVAAPDDAGAHLRVYAALLAQG